MKKIFVVLILSLSFQNLNAASFVAERRVNRMVSDIKKGRFAEQADEAISKLIRFSAWQLYRKGYRTQAKQMVSEYERTYDQYLTRTTKAGIFTNIGDHKPLFDWLAAMYEQIEIGVGFQTAELMHLTDLKTLNYGIPVVFNPCDFDMGTVKDLRIVEYRRHFSGKCDGEIYHGVAPVVTYWVAEIGCTAALWGSGMLLCMPIAEGAEFLMQNTFAQSLSDQVYAMAGCSN